MTQTRSRYALLLMIPVAAIAMLALAACSSDGDGADSEPVPTIQPAAFAETTRVRKQYDAPPPMTIDPNKKYTATFVLGGSRRFVVELYPKEAPVTVNSFVFLAREGYYDQVMFHRVIAGFMAQAGDPTGTGSGGPGYTFENEPSQIRRHDGPGVLSMANAGIRNGSGTNGSQFFITFVATPQLDGYTSEGILKDCSRPNTSCHTVFGRVIDGLDVVLGIKVRNPDTDRVLGERIETITIDEE